MRAIERSMASTKKRVAMRRPAPSESVQAAFGLFDDDSGSDDEQEPLARVSSQLAAIEIVAPESQIAREGPSPPPTADGLDVPSLYAPWDDVKPLAVGPIELVQSCEGIGGSRGYVAARDLEPGTQILVEQVFIPWPRDVEPADPEFFIATLESVLSRADYQDIMDHLGFLFPRELHELPADVLAAGRAKYDDQIAELVRNFRELPLEHDAVLQNVFAMQCNAFDSGVFLYNAMFNHNCNPNCVKFTPETSAAGDGVEGISEVRVAQSVRKGEPLTISYLYPREQSHERRQQNLREQFGFNCTCALCKRGDSALPPPATAAQAAEQGMSMFELEKILAATEELLKESPAGAANVLSIALEALSDALEMAAHDHIVFMRIHKLVADCCDLLLKSKPHQDVREYAILFLRSSYELLELQRSLLNPDHIDLARTLNDVSQGIQLLLSLDQKALLEEFPEWKDFRHASIVENQYRQEYRRIKKLYE
jgi:hypothetical protein